MALPKLTPAQRDLLLMAYRMGGRSSNDRPIDSARLGSKGGTSHLLRKGYLYTRYETQGPRGGLTPFYGLTYEGLVYAIKAAAHELRKAEKREMERRLAAADAL